jgi:hypothetical protein
MTLDDATVRTAFYCCSEVLRRRIRCGEPVPQWLKDHHAHLYNAVVLSRPGHRPGAVEPELKAEKLIGAREAADILGMSKRQVQRLAADLDGQIIDGRWLFKERTVLTYAEARHDGKTRGSA